MFGNKRDIWSYEERFCKFENLTPSIAASSCLDVPLRVRHRKSDSVLCTQQAMPSAHPTANVRDSTSFYRFMNTFIHGNVVESSHHNIENVFLDQAQAVKLVFFTIESIYFREVATQRGLYLTKWATSCDPGALLELRKS